MEEENVLERINGIISGCESQLKNCDAQIHDWMAKKRQIQQDMREALESIRKKCNFRRRTDEKTIGTLVLEFIRQRGETKLADIKQYLLSQGRTTNPGAALTRMTKKGIIESPKRGVYRILESSSEVA